MATALTSDAITASAPRRSDAGVVRLGRRDVHGLLLCAEQYACPYDLLAAALAVQPARLRGITARWRRAGYAATGRIDAGPAWCWLTPAGPGERGSPGGQAHRHHHHPPGRHRGPGQGHQARRLPAAGHGGLRGAPDMPGAPARSAVK